MTMHWLTGGIITALLSATLVGPVDAAQAAGATQVTPRARLEVPALVAVPAAVPASLAAPSNVRADKKTATSIRVWWSKVPAAKGYRVYRWDAKKKKYVTAKTITKASTTSWVDKKRKTGKEYKYVVAAYRVVKGKKVFGARSPWVSAVAHTKNAKVVNAGTIDFENYTVSVMEELSVLSQAKLTTPYARSIIVPSKASKAKKRTAANYTLRESFVSGQHLLRAVRTTGGRIDYAPTGPGTVKIRMMAHNGVTKTYAVRIVDYSRPARFLSELFQGGSALRLLLEKHVDQLRDLAYQTQKLATDGTWKHNANFSLRSNGSLGCEGTAYTLWGWEVESVTSECGVAPPTPVIKAVERLLFDFPYPSLVSVSGKTGQVVIGFWRTPGKRDVPSVVMFNPSYTYPPDPPLDGAPITTFWVARCWSARP